MTGAERLEAVIRETGLVGDGTAVVLAHRIIAGLAAAPPDGVTRTASWQLHWHDETGGADSWTGGWDNPAAAEASLAIERARNPRKRLTMTRYDTVTRRTEEPW